ncbi:MAG TPA: hypothetical protein DDY32_08275 [Desulfobulbaceae bacterium]|nr:hypothetical protein [Desulfobulbaceae bacterium]
MVEHENDKILTEILKAVSDTTRRSLLTQLCQQGTSRVTDLANHYDMSLNAISKHIKVLEKAGLVTRKAIGRTHWIEPKIDQVRLVENWFKELKSIWELRLEILDEIMKDGGTEMAELTVNIDKVINASIDKVFDAWLNPKMLSKFMRGMPDMPETDVEIDACEGGHFTFIMHLGDETIPHTGKFLEISRPDKLVFTWASRYSVVDNSTVTLNFTKIDDNTSKISLSHVKFIDEEARSGHEGGWRCVLDNLNEVMK